jgi:hypothetical protein
MSRSIEEILSMLISIREQSQALGLPLFERWEPFFNHLVRVRYQRTGDINGDGPIAVYDALTGEKRFYHIEQSNDGSSTFVT